MVAVVRSDQWQAVRTSVKATGDRFAELISAAPDPLAKVTADWTVADMAAHVTAIAWQYTTMVRAQDAPLPMSAIDDVVPATTVDSVAVLNETTLRHFPERDPRVLAQQLRAHIDDILRGSDGLDPERPVGWLGGSRVPRAGVVAHLLNELLIHGRDIARGIRAPWTIPPHDAALFFDLFLVGVIRHDVGRLLEGGGPPMDRRIAVDFRSRYTSPVTLVLHSGQVTVEDPRRDNDIRLSFDPPTLNLVLFHRIRKVRAALTGKIVVTGRRPWLLPSFLRTVRLP